MIYSTINARTSRRQNFFQTTLTTCNNTNHPVSNKFVTKNFISNNPVSNNSLSKKFITKKLITNLYD